MPLSLRQIHLGPSQITLTRTGLLNMSLLACAAMPPPIFGALDRRAATPLTLSLSEKVAL